MTFFSYCLFVNVNLQAINTGSAIKPVLVLFGFLDIILCGKNFSHKFKSYSGQEKFFFHIKFHTFVACLHCICLTNASPRESPHNLCQLLQVINTLSSMSAERMLHLTFHSNIVCLILQKSEVQKRKNGKKIKALLLFFLPFHLEPILYIFQNTP